LFSSDLRAVSFSLRSSRLKSEYDDIDDGFVPFNTGPGREGFRVGTKLAMALRGLKLRIPSRKRNNRPEEPVLAIDSPADDSVVTGLLPIAGWAFTASRVAPEGIVEAALDDEDDWAELKNRMPVDCIDPSAARASRCGFQAALNTFLLPNGGHRLRLRVKAKRGRVALEREVRIQVSNVGRLAETTARLLRGHHDAKRLWTDVIDSSHFPFEEGRDVAWFSRPGAEVHIPDVIARHRLEPQYDPHLRKFLRDGYIVLDDFVPSSWCEEINRDLESLIRSGTLQCGQKGQRVEKLHEYSKPARDLWTHPEILKILSAIFDDVALPCQTLNFVHGSQQDVHQDVIHLTPFPAGMMCGVWVALEDIHPDAGPLVVYPGSHRLPRLYTRTVPVDKVRNGDWRPFGSKYTPRVRDLITQAGLQPFYYTPKAGSVLIWHESLAHGGSPRKNDDLTRKSMVSHYFARGAVAFYDSTGSPGWTHED